jgi:hypothetical protein
MRIRSTLFSGMLIVTAMLPPAASAVAPNMVLAWNQIAAEALVNAPTASPPGAGRAANVAILDLAIVQGAVYDAVNSIDRGHEPLIDSVAPAPATASKEAAAATAAHQMLLTLAPPALPQVVVDRLNTLYASSLAGIPDSQAKTDGIAAGAAAASAMFANRANDGRNGPFRFTTGTKAGEWRPDLPAFVSDPNAWMARVRPFTLKSTSQFRTMGPTALTSDEYTAEYNEVKTLGSLTGSSRSPEQSAVAAFFTENAILLGYRTIRDIAMNEGLSIVESARLFGMAGISTGDAVIGCWDNKAYWSNWRPITAIRQGDNDGNPATVGQGDWLPLLPTPPYPDVSSGYNCFTAATMYSAANFFGTDKFTFTMHSTVSNTDRTYDRFSRVLRDTVDARVYQGLHFRTADKAGAWLGKKVANWVDKYEFGPVD